MTLDDRCQLFASYLQSRGYIASSQVGEVRKLAEREIQDVDAQARAEENKFWVKVVYDIAMRRNLTEIAAAIRALKEGD